jgi:hypothetical protein
VNAANPADTAYKAGTGEVCRQLQALGRGPEAAGRKEVIPENPLRTLIFQDSSNKVR